MGLLIAAVVLLAGYGTAYVASEEVRYLSRAGFEETRLLAAREPLSVLARDTTRPQLLRSQAQLVLDVRAYAEYLGLQAKETYTSYTDVGRDTLLLVLTASAQDCLCPVTWKYPIVGRVPYKGFFDFAQAQAKADAFAAEGYDVSLRPSAAFSTLGWFNDPLLSTALERDPVELAALVFHEIAHNTIWVKGATAFNESYAQWVGYRAAETFFLSRGDSLSARQAADRWHDERVLDTYYRLLMGKLDSLYALKLPARANGFGREAIAGWSRDTLLTGLGAYLRATDPRWYAGRPINNATLIGVRLYRTNLDVFDAWDRLFGGDLTRALDELRLTLEGAEDTEGAFRRMEAMLRLRNVPVLSPLPDLDPLPALPAR